MGQETCHYRIGCVAVSLTSDVQEAHDDYNLLYGHLRCQAASQETLRFDVSSMKPRPFAKAVFVIRYQDELYEAGSTLNAVLPELEYAINQQVIRQYRSYLLFHAGVMSFQGHGVVMPADSGTGKTTLTATLLKRGWKYLSDEFALINPLTLEVHPFPKALCVKDHGKPVIERMGIPYVQGREFLGREKYARVYVNPVEVDANPYGEVSPVNWLFFLTRRDQLHVQFKQPTTSESSMHLYRTGLNTMTYRQRGLETAMKLSQKANCYHLDLGDPLQTAEHLETLLGEHEPAECASE